jgi:hypothetical protein
VERVLGNARLDKAAKLQLLNIDRSWRVVLEAHAHLNIFGACQRKDRL